MVDTRKRIRSRRIKGRWPRDRVTDRSINTVRSIAVEALTFIRSIIDVKRRAPKKTGRSTDNE